MKEYIFILISGAALCGFAGYLLHSSSYFSSGTSAVMGGVALWLAAESLYWQGRADARKDVERMNGRDLG